MQKTLLTTLAIQLALFVLSPANANAETLVLIHGYLGDRTSWFENKTTLPLEQAGWRYGGNYTVVRAGQFIIQTPPTQVLQAKSKDQDNAKLFFTVDLPAEAPIEFQAGLLGLYLTHLYENRHEPLILVGHSAGGVIARAWLTKPTAKPVKALITIASPHLGTPLVKLATLASATPLNEMGRMMGLKNFRKSTSLFADLKEEKRGNYLFWLNHLPHPDIVYVSIIRNKKAGFNKFDYVVPKKNQNMNNVWALRGKSAVLYTTGDHFLSMRDGIYIRDMVNRLSE